MKKNNFYFSNRAATIAVLVAIIFTSCKKFVTVDPPRTQLTSSAVFQSDASAISAISGLYVSMSQSPGFISGNNQSITMMTGLSSDELTNYSTNPTQTDFYNNTLKPINTTVRNNLWQEGYTYIFYANNILEGLDKSEAVSAPIKKQLQGEVKFVRAFCHFYLLNLFGDIPIVTSTNYAVNAMASRSPVKKVYDQIISDLLSAQSLLSSDFPLSSGERVRPTSWAATSMLARVYLYNNDPANAIAQSSLVVANSTLFQLNSNLNGVFLKNSTEAIWQLMPVLPGYNTNEGSNFILTSVPSTYALSPGLINAFEPGDLRKTAWTNSFNSGTQTYSYAFKYKVRTGSTLTEYSMMLRLAEQYLIRAEARAQMDNLIGAVQDINIIRVRAGLGATTATAKSDVLLAIEQERRVELFTEVGQRWLDLKRTGRSGQVLSAIKPGWKPSATLYPIPQLEIQNDPNLVQNPGY